MRKKRGKKKGVCKMLATNLKTRMGSGGIKSQTQLAALTGISQSQIGNILREDRAASIDTIQRLADGLECEPWLLLSPVGDLEAFNDPDFQIMIHCYLRLMPTDQDAITNMTRQLYEASGTSFR